MLTKLSKKSHVNTTIHPKKVALFVIVSMSFMATLDLSIVNMALPVMTTQMKVPLSSIEWVVAAYSLMICATLLFFGRLGDIPGKSKVFQGGTVLFTLASLACGLCESLYPLIFCRIFQGLGASAYMANNQGLITELYPQEGRGKAMGILAASVALGTMTGPPLGGMLLSVWGWNSIFWVNIPIGIVVYITGIFLLPRSTPNHETMDWKGAFLQFSGIILFFGTLIEAQQKQFDNPHIKTALLAATLLIVAFIAVEKHQKQPLLHLDLLRHQSFSLGLLCALISFICISASIILLPFYLQNTLKLTPIQAGFFLMISPLIITILSPLCGSLSDRLGSRGITQIGLAIMGIGFLMMASLNAVSPIALCALFVGMTAVGQALFQPANNSRIMSASPQNKLGISGSLNAWVRNVGQITGLTFSTTLLYFWMSQKSGLHVHDYLKGQDDLFVYAMQNVYLVLAALCGIGVILTTFRLRGKNHLV